MFNDGGTMIITGSRSANEPCWKILALGKRVLHIVIDMKDEACNKYGIRFQLMFSKDYKLPSKVSFNFDYNGQSYDKRVIPSVVIVVNDAETKEYQISPVNSKLKILLDPNTTKIEFVFKFKENKDKKSEINITLEEENQ